MFAKNYVTIALAQNVVNEMPRPGSIMTRRQFEASPNGYFHGGYGDMVWSLTRNYRCLDVYSDTQRVQLEGAALTVWAHDQATSAHSVVMPGENLALAIAMLYAVAKNMCPHRNATETASSRMGLHEYKCNDCGAYFGIDSSD